MFKHIYKKETSSLDKLVADRIEKIICKNNEENKNTYLILATGNSPVGVYKELIKKHNNGLSFEKVISYNLDEYLKIKKFPNDSFRKFMDDNLFNHIDIKKENTHFPNKEKSYNKLLDKIDKFDFTILGVGTNGHIAFNEPGTKFEYRTNKVTLKASTIASNFPGRTEYPTSAITMGLFDIYNKSSEINLLAFGESKRDALLKLKECKKDSEWPISYFYDHSNITIFTNIDVFEKGKK